MNYSEYESFIQNRMRMSHGGRAAMRTNREYFSKTTHME